jgi:hypothetical protein
MQQASARMSQVRLEDLLAGKDFDREASDPILSRLRLTK